jgi:GH25 family lysozyme M1 (1,4-beta-N-acetylmuramidase)
MAPQTATPATTHPSGYSVFGIDVSSHQGTVNWTSVKNAGASFAYVKATEGTTYTNPYFDQQYGGAKNAGLYAGAYVFARPDGDPVAEARYFFANSGYVRDGKTLPLMLDMEGPYPGLSTTALCWGKSQASMIAWMHSFVTTIRQLSGSPMLIYTNNWWWSQCTGNTDQFTTEYLNTAYWSSSPPSTLPGGWSKWTIWQYTGSGSISGVSGAVDQDAFNGSMADLAQFADRPIKDALAQSLIPNDFNLDQHSDPGVFHPATGDWGIARDTGTTWEHFGMSGDIPIVWNSGDGWAKMGVYRPSKGAWYLADHQGNLQYWVQYGARGDTPVPSHYWGSQKPTDLAVFRPSNGTWYLRYIGAFQFGTRGDIPVPGVYRPSSTHTDTIAVFRPWKGDWYLRGIGAYHWGWSGDIPVPADYNSDGVTDLAVYRPSNGTWYVRGVGTYQFGASGDIPVTGDFNGDGKAEPAVFRPSTGRFYRWGLNSVALGSASDIPIGQAPFRG